MAAHTLAAYADMNVGYLLCEEQLHRYFSRFGNVLDGEPLIKNQHMPFSITCACQSQSPACRCEAGYRACRQCTQHCRRCTVCGDHPSYDAEQRCVGALACMLR